MKSTVVVFIFCSFARCFSLPDFSADIVNFVLFLLLHKMPVKTDINIMDKKQNYHK